MEGREPFMSDNGQAKALETAVAGLRKRFGEGAIMKLGEARHLQVESIPTGSLALDIALGVGGVPKGRVIEIYGPESSGKTTLCQHIIAEAQRMGGVAAFVDVEHALDPVYAEKCGVVIDDLYVSQPDTGEQALEITEALVRSGVLAVVVVDSVAALVPRAEIEGDMGDAHMGLQARLMSQALRKLAGPICKHNTLLIFTNQLRFKTGVFLGNPETSTGGTLAPERKCRCGPAFLRLGPDRPASGSSGQIKWRGHRSAYPGYGQEEQSGPALPLG
jgi:recombination protein RecA